MWPRGIGVRKALVIPGVVLAAGGGLTAHELAGRNDEPLSRVPKGSGALVQSGTQSATTVRARPSKRNGATRRSEAAEEPRETVVTVRLRKTKRRSTLARGRPAGADANRQVGALARSISARLADGEITVDDANKILARADQ